MNEKENFELAAKILYFGTLEEAFSIEAAKGIARAESKEALLSEVHMLILKRKKKKANIVNLTQSSFAFPEGIDMSYWREFKSNCSRSAFLSVLYKWIGGLSDEEICSVLKISQGSLYSRYNLGLKSFGELLMSSQIMLGV